MNANPSVDSRQVNRLAIIRRLYLYVVVVVSLGVILSALDSLTSALVDALFSGAQGWDVGGDSFLRDTVARSAGTLLVATPLFLAHWFFARRLLPQSPERFSALRKLALYLVALMAFFVAAQHLHQWLFQSIALLLGQSDRTLDFPFASGQWLYWLIMVIISAGLGWFMVDQLRADGDSGNEVGRSGTVRRLFQTFAGLVGFAVALFGGSSLLEVPLHLLLQQFDTSRAFVGRFDWGEMAANGAASLLIGLLVWWINGRVWDRLIAKHPAEGATALRRFYLYAATLISAGVALTPAAMLLSDILRRIFGYPSNSPLIALANPLSLIVLGILAWRWYWGQVQAEAARFGDSPESANVRRLYYYLVAAIGLVLTWIGLVDILRLILDWLLVSGIALDEYGAGQAANGLSMLAVGAPVWVIHWRTVQRAAEGEITTAQAERRSGPRRAYLYGVALAGALLILFDLGSVIYRLILGLLGEWSGSAPILDALARSGTAVVFWALHLLAIRTDTRLTGDAEEADTDDGDTGEQGAGMAKQRAALKARIAQLEQSLTQAKAELDRLDTYTPGDPG